MVWADFQRVRAAATKLEPLKSDQLPAAPLQNPTIFVTKLVRLNRPISEPSI